VSKSRHEPGSTWYQRGKKPGLRSRRYWWRELKAQGRCVCCWKPRDREGSLCRRCCERAKLRARRKRGWDGRSPWQPKQQGRAPRRSVCCTLPLADYDRLKQLVDDEGSTIGALVREVVLTYLGDVFDGGA
jgi:hypothetical protein